MPINKETGEILEYPYLDSEGRLICDPNPVSVPVELIQVGMSDTQLPSTLIRSGFDVDHDGMFDDDDVLDDSDIMPMTQYEIDALNLKLDAPAKGEEKAPEGDSPQPPLE
nr:MAG: hypothetical protein [Microvirus sp.]